MEINLPIEKYEDGDITIAPIGMLEWDMEYGACILDSHLQYMRPAMQKDVSGEKLCVRAHVMDMDAVMRGDPNEMRQALLYVLIESLKQLEKDGAEGKVNLVMYNKFLRWDVTISCIAYMPV